jgi:predicted RNase H-like HicB family nuclease
MANWFKKKKKQEVPGITVKCESGRYLAFYEHRTDIIANGDNEKQAIKNLKRMYKVVIATEEEEEQNRDKQNRTLALPKNSEVHKFTEKLSRV